MLNLNDRDRCFVIAEAGTCHASPNHNQRVGFALKYVETAKDAGADAIKFQMFCDPNPETMFCWMDGDEHRVARWRWSAIPFDGWCQIKEFADGLGIMFLVSTFEHVTVGWLNELGVEATKVASRAAMCFPYGESPEPYLVSMGMSGEPPTRQERYFLEPGVKPPHLLKCEARYPSTLVWDGTADYGFSDHSGNPWRAIDAISRGCKLVEVHFFINPIHAGPDRPASLNVPQLKMVCEARDAFVEMQS